MSTYFERRQAKILGIEIEPEIEPAKAAGKKPSKKLPKVGRSEKLSKVMSILRAIYPSFLAGYEECEIKSPACTGQVETVHHTKGRGINIVFLQKYWKRCCCACNDFVEKKDEWAKENGHKVSRHAEE